MTGILLTVDELKGYIQDTAESNETLQQRIDDTEAELNRRFGRLALDDDAIDTVTERLEIRGFRPALTLSQDADEILSVKADGVDEALDTTVYRLRETRDLVYLIGLPWNEFEGAQWPYANAISGTAGWPYTYLDVVYRPLDSRAARRRGLIKLIQLDMNYQPGMGGQSGGPWAESYSGGGYDAQREAIFNSIEMPDLFA